MCRLQSSSYTGAGVATGVHDVLAIMILCLIEQGLDSRLGERPCARIKRLFLAPNDCLGVRVHVKIFLQLLPWERVQLLNARDGGVGKFVVGPVLMQRSVYLAGTENNTVNLRRVSNGIAVLWVRNDPSEMSIARKFLNGGPTEWMSEKRLGEEDDQSWLYS